MSQENAFLTLTDMIFFNSNFPNISVSELTIFGQNFELLVHSVDKQFVQNQNYHFFRPSVTKISGILAIKIFKAFKLLTKNHCGPTFHKTRKYFI